MPLSRLFVAAAMLVAGAASATAGEPAYGGSYPARPGYAGAGGASGVAPGRTAYPVLGAPLYPSPVQYTPPWTGGTVITNQALAPHEMLYPHRYHAMYGPFYYNVCGSWIVTPFGVRQHEKWKLEGTHVKVKYHPHHKLFSGFHPPVSH
jgi:hypothetical protein